MSSKVMIENRTDAARPFAWRTVALSGETLDRRRTAAESKPASLDPHHPLEKRIAELERLQAQESSRVRLHPDHVPALRVALERLGMGAKVEIIADPAQEPGAAIFEMTRGNLDASMDSQLREIERGLADRFQRPW